MLVCNNCWQKKEECKCVDRDMGEQYVEIDDKIYPAIRQLNLLGYRTVFCCEGHTDKNKTIQSYIVFNCDRDNKMFEALPEGWQYESYNYKKIKHYKYNIIRSVINFNKRQIDKMSDEQKQDIIDNNINNLIKWTKTLSPR